METDSLVTKFFKVSNIFRVEYNDETGKVSVFQAIVKLFNNDELRLGLLIEQSLKPITEGSKLFLVINNNGIDNYFTTTVKEIINNNKQIILITLKPKLADISSLRRFFRCDVHLEFTYKYREKDFQGWIKNLSACGLLAISRINPELRLGFILDCDFSIPTFNETINVKGQLVRLDSAPDGKQLIAIDFFDITEKHQSEIIKYLFQRQREMAQKAR